VIVELSTNGHVDGVAIALSVLALVALDLGRRNIGGLLLGAAAAAKLLPLLLWPSLRSRKATLLAALMVVACFLPYGGRATGSLGEYARRWRGNEGAFALLYEGAARMVPDRPLSPGPRWARWATGRDRDRVYPDELANLLARLAAAAAVATAVALAIRAGRPALGLAEVALGAFLLFSPTLHPWYVLWMLPLCALKATGSAAWLTLAALAPLSYVPLGELLRSGTFRDPVWTRALEHGATWSVLSGLLARRRIR
jgi:hypothetical protein